MILFHQLLLTLALAIWTGPHPDVQDSGTVEAPGMNCGKKNVTFQPGEEIVYKIYYNMSPFWIPAGEVVFTVSDAGNDLHYSVNAHTYKSYEWFYRGIYTFDSYVDKASLMPHVFQRTIEEKKFSEYNKYVFDQAHGKVASWHSKNSGDTEFKEVDISPCMHDMISVMYYVRNLDFDKLHTGETIPVSIYLDEEFPLSVKVLGINEEKRIHGIGKQMTHVFSPQVVSGDIFNENTQMTVWVSADSNKIPLMIESPVRIGKVKAVLKSYSGLRHQFTLAD